VRAIALRGVVADLDEHLRRRPDLTKQFLEAVPAAAKDWDGEVRRRSVLTFADQLRVPVLMLHARQDWRVSPAGAEALDARLAEAGTPHRLVMIDPDEHQLMLHRRELRQEIQAGHPLHLGERPLDTGEADGARLAGAGPELPRLPRPRRPVLIRTMTTVDATTSHAR